MMMKKFLNILFFLMGSLALFAQENQTKLGIRVNVTTVVPQGGNDYLVTASIEDATNVYDGTDVQVGDVLWTNSTGLGDDCNQYEVTDITCGGCSVFIGFITVIVTDNNSQPAPSTGIGAVADPGFIGWVANIGDPLNQCIQSYSMGQIRMGIDSAFQNLSISNDTLSIQYGNFVVLPSGGGGGMAIGGTVTGGTSGSVLFIDAVGQLAQDNAAFFWDSPNDRLGIGTNSPAYNLDVLGSGNLSRTYTTSGTFLEDSGMFISATVTSDNGSASRYPRGLVGSLTTAGSTDFGADSELIGLGGGASHAASVTVNSMTGLFGGMTMTGTGTVTSGQGLYGRLQWNANGTYTTGSGVLGQIYINTAASSANGTDVAIFRGEVVEIGTPNITTLYGLYLPDITQGTTNYGVYSAGTAVNYFGGNVGIGTNTPQNKLHIIETAIASTREQVFTMQISDAGNDALLIGNATSADSEFSPSVSGYKDSDDDISSLSIRGLTSAGQDVSNSFPMILFQAMRTDDASNPLNGSFTDIENRDILQVWNNSTALMTVDQAGRLGVGTTTPSERVHIYSNVNDFEDLLIENDGTGSNSTAGMRAINGNDDWAFLRVYDSAFGEGLADNAAFGGTNDIIIITDAATDSGGTGSIQFRTGGFEAAQERMIIDAAGQVGIGTSTPEATIHVTGPDYGSFRLEREVASDPNTLGIGDFKAKTSVNMTDNFGPLMYFAIEDNTSGNLYIGAFGAERTNGQDNSGDMAFYTYDTGVRNQVMRLTYDQKMGVGTSDPDWPFVVSHDGSGGTVAAEAVNTGASGPAGGGLMLLTANDGAALAPGDRIGGFLYAGSASASDIAYTAGIFAFATEAWTFPTALGTELRFETVENGTGSRTEKLRILHDGQIRLLSYPSNLYLGSGADTITHVLGFNSAGDGSVMSIPKGSLGSGGGGLWTANGSDIYYNTGNVGIGTDTPLGPLHLSSDTEPLFWFDRAGSDSSGPGGLGRKSRGTIASPVIVQENDVVFQLYGQGYDGTDFETSGGILMRVDGTPASDDVAGRIEFQTATGGALSTKMTLDQNGNLGVGTTNPDNSLHLVETAIASTRETVAKFQVSDVGGDALYMSNATSADAAFIPTFGGYVDSGERQTLFFKGMTDAANDVSETPSMIAFQALRTDDPNDPLNGTPTDIVNRNLFGFFNNGTEVLTIDADGNLGIGANDPVRRLHVETDQANVARFVSTAASDAAGGPAVRMYNDDGAAIASGHRLALLTMGAHNGTALATGAQWEAFATETWTPSANGTKMAFLTTANGASNASQRLVIDHNGNIGVNVSDPDELLHVQASHGTSTREVLMQGDVTDSGADVFAIMNGTSVDGTFMPTFRGMVVSDTRNAFAIEGFTDSPNDIVDTEPLVVVRGRIVPDTLDPWAGGWQDVTLRDLFSVENNNNGAGFVVGWNHQVRLPEYPDSLWLGVGSDTITHVLGFNSAGDGSIMSIPKGQLGSGGTGLWTATGSDIYYDSGLVGVGHNAPQATLDVRRTWTTSGVSAEDRLSYFDATVTSDNASANRYPRGSYTIVRTAGTTNFGGVSSLVGQFGLLSHTANIDINEGIGLSGMAFIDNSATAGTFVALSGTIQQNDGTSIDDAVGVLSRYTRNGTGITITNYDFFRADLNLLSGGETITTMRGLYIPDLTLGSNNFGLYVDGTTKSYFGGRVGYNVEDPESVIHTVGGDNSDIINERIQDDVSGAGTQFKKSRGTIGSEAIVQNGDQLYRSIFLGYDGNDYQQAAMIRVEVDGVPGTDIMPTRFEFDTRDTTTSATMSRKMMIDGFGQMTWDEYGTANFAEAGSDTAVYLLGAGADGKIYEVAKGSGSSDGDWTISGSDMYSAVNGNVGIGNSTPSRKLHVEDDDTAPMIVDRTTTATSSEGGTVVFKNTTSGDMADGFGPAFIMAIEDNAASEQNLGSIGAARFGNDDTGEFFFNVNQGGGTFVKAFKVYGENSVANTLVARAGHVGINTDLPTVDLDINMTSGNSIAMRAIRTQASGPSGGAFAGLYIDDDAAPASGDRFGGFLIGADDGAGTLINGALIAAFATENWTATTAAGTKLQFETTPNGSTTRGVAMTIDHNQKVGIGDTSPGALLDVERTFTTIADATQDRTAFFEAVVTANSSAVNLYPRAFTGQLTTAGSTDFGSSSEVFAVQGQIVHDNGQDLVRGAGFFARYSNGSSSGTTTGTGMGVEGRFQMNGGTTTNGIAMNATFTQNGTGTVTNAYLFRGEYSDIGGTITSTNFYGLHLPDVDVATNNWGLYVEGATMDNYIAGNLGIGTTDPTAALHIASDDFPVVRGERTNRTTDGASAVFELLADRDGNMADGFGPFFNFAIKDDADLIESIADFGAVRSNGNDQTGDIVFRNYDAGTRSESMRIMYNGNVGIGEAAPDALLEVAGECIITGTIWLNAGKTLGIFTGTGSPESSVSADVGSTFHRTDGGSGTSYYVKESGTGNTGWVAK